METVDAFHTNIKLVDEAFMDLKTYQLSHPHLREIPRFGTDTFATVLKWAKNW